MEEIAKNEVKNIMEAEHYVNPFECGQHAGKLAKDIKDRLKEGWKINKTMVTVSYFIEKEE